MNREAPQESGVYGLLCPPDRWIYIGESENINEALMQHLEEIPSVVGLVWFTLELLPPSECTARRQDLIRGYGPVCNEPITHDSIDGIPLSQPSKRLIDRVEDFVSQRPELAFATAVVLGAAVGILVSL